jgi:hypothetical protein
VFICSLRLLIESTSPLRFIGDSSFVTSREDMGEMVLIPWRETAKYHCLYIKLVNLTSEFIYFFDSPNDCERPWSRSGTEFPFDVKGVISIPCFVLNRSPIMLTICLLTALVGWAITIVKEKHLNTSMSSINSLY